MTRARALKASHSCPCRQDRRTLYHRAPPRPEQSPAAPARHAAARPESARPRRERQPPAAPKAVPLGREGPREDRPRPRPLVRRARSVRRRREGTHRRGAAPATRITRSTAGTRRASPSPTNARAACAPPTSAATASTEVSVSKVVAADAADVIKAFTETRASAALDERRRRVAWSSALAAALDSPASKGFVVRADGLGTLSLQVGRHDRAALPVAETRRQSVHRRDEQQAVGRHDGRRAAEAVAADASTRWPACISPARRKSA